jgi:hypothetical protein
VPLRAYLSDGSDDIIDAISAAINKLINASGFEISDDFDAVIGSWYKKWFAKTTEVATQPEVVKRLEKIERALELKGLGQPQAEIDKKQAEATATLLKAVEKVPNTAIQVGSILLVKVSGPNGPVVQVRTLSHRELIEIENNPNILVSPADVLKTLSTLCNDKSETASTNKSPDDLDAVDRGINADTFTFTFPNNLPQARAVRKGRAGKAELSSAEALQLKGPQGPTGAK